MSGSVKQAMAAIGLPAERIAVHYPAVDTDLFRPGDRGAAKARLGISGPLLLAVGNLIPEKGHWLAVEALARLDGATLIIVGNGPERAALLARARRLGVAERLRLPGSLPHALLPAFFTAADVTVHPSLVEGFGNVRLESLACGTPLVTTAVGEAAHRRPARGRADRRGGPAGHSRGGEEPARRSAAGRGGPRARSAISAGRARPRSWSGIWRRRPAGRRLGR